MSEWREIQLGKYLSILSGFAFDSERFTDGVGMPLIRIRDLDKKSTEVHYSGPYKNQFIINKGDILIGMDGDFLVTRWKGNTGLLNQRVCKIETKNPDRLNETFIYYRIIKEIQKINDITSATTVKHLSVKNIDELRLSIPKNEKEQSRIATILNTVDKAIEQTEQLIAKYQRIKTGLLQDLLTRGIDKNGKIRSEETHEFKDSPLGRIPKEWNATELGTLAIHLRSGVTPRGGSKVYRTQGIPLIRSQNVYPSGIIWNDMAFITKDVHDTMKGSALEPFDVLLNITGASIGRSTIVPQTLKQANVNQHVCAIRMEAPHISKSIFMSEFLNSSLGQNQIYRFNAGSNREGLNYSQIRQMEIAWPSDSDEFKRIANRIGAFTTTLKVHEEELSKLNSIKSGLMQDLLSGKVRVDIKTEKMQE